MLDSVASQKILAMNAPPEKRAAALAFVAEQEASIPAKRERRAVDIDAIHHKLPEPLEKDILKDCITALRAHPKVAFVGRFNRGVMQSTYNGRDSYTQFNTVPGFPDIHGMLEGGAAFYIEVKRPKTGKLDAKQSNFLAIIRACGGIAGVATSAAEALALIAPTFPY